MDTQSDLAFFPQSSPTKPSLDQILAATAFSELLAGRLDLYRLPNGVIAKTPRHALAEHVDPGILELDHLSAIDAHKVVMRGFLKEIRVIRCVVVTKIDLTQQIRLHQQGERAIHRGARCFFIGPPHSFKQFFSTEMFILRKNRVDDAVTLLGAPQAFAADERRQFLANQIVHDILLGHTDDLAKRNRHCHFCRPQGSYMRNLRLQVDGVDAD